VTTPVLASWNIPGIALAQRNAQMAQGLVWTVGFWCLFHGLGKLREGWLSSFAAGGVKMERAALERVVSLFRELEDTLAAGLIPAPSRWEAVQRLSAPWGVLAHESIQELRRQGGALLPTLGRLREFANHHREVLADAESRSSQAVVQAIACAGLVPLFAGMLYLLLPGIDAHLGLWAVVCALALSLAVFGAKWILRLAETARWASLPRGHRNGLLSVQCAGERFLALIRAGNPADIAWSKSCEWLATHSPELAAHWGYSLWTSEPVMVGEHPAILPLIDLGNALKKSAQVSLMEGRPCLERSEASLRAFRCEMKVRTDRELVLLPTRALKPLFLCVAPALMGMLGFGLWLSWLDQFGGNGGI